jgi:hypothetical protein
MKDCRRKSARNRAYALSLDADTQCLQRRSLLFHDFHNVRGGTSRYGCEQHVERTGTCPGIAIDPDFRAIDSASIEL